MINTTISLAQIATLNKNTLIDHLGIIITELGENYLVGTMPVDSRTHQPAGLLHGGASAALVESLGSIGSSLIVDLSKQGIVGLEVNTNHVRGVKSGTVTAKAEIVHCGRSTHVWQVNIHNEDQKLVATGRLTVMITNK
jgi:1,4-dihydroxy-2-naphthoyl-CoA hydrolase